MTDHATSVSINTQVKNVVVGIPCLLQGGTEYQTLSLTRALISGGWHVTICCYFNEVEAEMADGFRAAGAEVVLLGIDRRSCYGRVWSLFQLLKSLTRFLRKARPDVVHVQYIAPGLLPIIAARLAGVSTIFATVHIAGSVAYGRKAKLMLQAASRLCSTFFCVSQGVERFWFGDSLVFDPDGTVKNRRHYTIYNAIDADGIAIAADRSNRRILLEKHAIPAAAPIIGCVGRLAVQKGHAVLLKAMKVLLHSDPAVILLVVGDGPERENLRQQARRLGIEPAIRWVGALPQEAVFGYYAIINIFAMPSRYEGFGLVAAEAMAVGLPVVGTKIEGLEEVVADGETGLLVPPDNPDELAAALMMLLSDPERSATMGAAGYQRVKTMFSMETFSSNILAAYRGSA